MAGLFAFFVVRALGELVVHRPSSDSFVSIPASGSIMTLVVLTAAMSSLNSGLYSTGRILRSMSVAGSAPRFTARMSRHQVPYGGILLTAGAALLGVGLNAWLPGEAF